MYRSNPQMNEQTDRLKTQSSSVHMDVCAGAWKNLEENKSHFGKAGGIAGRSGCSSSAFEFLRGMYQVSLEVQCLRIRLPVQGTQVASLDCEDSTRHGAIGPMCHND